LITNSSTGSPNDLLADASVAADELAVPGSEGGTTALAVVNPADLDLFAVFARLPDPLEENASSNLQVYH
jgi:hypothetical protein